MSSPSETTLKSLIIVLVCVYKITVTFGYMLMSTNFCDTGKVPRVVACPNMACITIHVIEPKSPAISPRSTPSSTVEANAKSHTA